MERKRFMDQWPLIRIDDTYSILEKMSNNERGRYGVRKRFGS